MHQPHTTGLCSHRRIEGGASRVAVMAVATATGFTHIAGAVEGGQHRLRVAGARGSEVSLDDRGLRERAPRPDDRGSIGVLSVQRPSGVMDADLPKATRHFLADQCHRKVDLGAVQRQVQQQLHGSLSGVVNGVDRHYAGTALCQPGGLLLDETMQSSISLHGPRQRRVQGSRAGKQRTKGEAPQDHSCRVRCWIRTSTAARINASRRRWPCLWRSPARLRLAFCVQALTGRWPHEVHRRGHRSHCAPSLRTSAP